MKKEVSLLGKVLSVFRSLNLVLKIGMIAVVVIFVVFLFNRFSNDKKEAEIISTSTLEKIINVSELSTFEAVYNGIAVVNNEENPENVDYYVSYKAKVQAGIDFEKIKVSKDDESKKVVVKLPEIKLDEPMVDIASMDYIFENKRADTETVSEQAYKKCIEDAKKESENEEAIYTLAKQNAENIIKALVNPFIEDMDEKYELMIIFPKE